MKKLIYEHTDSDGYTYSCISIIPFEYESKDNFVFDMLEKISQSIATAELTDSYPSIDFLGMEKVSIYVEGIATGAELFPQDIERNTYTLDEWFEKDKKEPFSISNSINPQT